MFEIPPNYVFQEGYLFPYNAPRRSQPTFKGGYAALWPINKAQQIAVVARAWTVLVVKVTTPNLDRFLHFLLGFSLKNDTFISI